MTKDTARRILDVKNKGLADHLMITEGAVRNIKNLTKAQEMMVILYYDLKCVTQDNINLQDKYNRLLRAMDS